MAPTRRHVSRDSIEAISRAEGLKIGVGCVFGG